MYGAACFTIYSTRIQLRIFFIFSFLRMHYDESPLPLIIKLGHGILVFLINIAAHVSISKTLRYCVAKQNKKKKCHLFRLPTFFSHLNYIFIAANFRNINHIGMRDIYHMTERDVRCGSRLGELFILQGCLNHA